MSQWNQGGQYPPDPKGLDVSQPGCPPKKSGYPAEDGHPPKEELPTAPPSEEYPPPSYSQAIGFIQPPPPNGGGDSHANGENEPTNNGNCGFISTSGAVNINFTDEATRRGFIRMVFSILLAQFGVILMIITLFFYYQSTKQYFQDHVGLFYASLVILVVSTIALAFCDELRRKRPNNRYLLFTFTVVLGFCLAFSAATYNLNALPMIVGFTAMICLVISVYVLQTKYNFNLTTGILLIGLLILVIFLTVGLCIETKMMVSLACALFTSLLLSFYFVYDTQLMMGGKHGTHMYSISPDEYIFAVLNLYVDGINIFRHCLNTMGKAN